MQAPKPSPYRQTQTAVPYAPVNPAEFPRTLDELQTAIAQVLVAEHVSAAALALTSDDEILWAGGFGSGVDAAQPATPATSLRLGAVSGSVTSG